MKTRHRLETFSLALILSATALVVGPAPASAQDVILSQVPKDPCCFNNFRFAGTCRVMPRQGQYCENILSYLNNFNSAGEAYCSSTYIRGGWSQLDCPSGGAAAQIGTTTMQPIQAETPSSAGVSRPSTADVLRPQENTSRAIDTKDLTMSQASVIQVRLEQPLDGQLDAGQQLTGSLVSDLLGPDGEVLAPAGSMINAEVGAEHSWDQAGSASLQLHLVGTTTSAADLFGTAEPGDVVETALPAIHLTGDLVELSPESVLSFELKDVSEQPEDMRVLTTATAVWMDAFNKRDAVTIAGLSSDDGALLPPNGRAIIGREAIYSYWKGTLNDSEQRIELVNVETVVEGNLGYKAGRFELIDSTGEAVDRGKYIQIWKRSHGGYWELHRDMWNSSADKSAL